MKLSSGMSLTDFNFREYKTLGFFYLTNCRALQSKLTLALSTSPVGNHQRKNHPVNLPLHQLQKWRGWGGRDTLPRGQDATHTGHQHIRKERLPLPQCQQRTQRKNGRERRPLARASSAEGHPEGTRY